ncbi:MAG: Gfo/Idh/MocA family oxidoreductase [Bryobacteraceae bacterium]
MNPVDQKGSTSRRHFLAGSLAGGFAFPAIVPSRVLGQSAPSNIIRVAQIGCGRQARDSEIPGILRHSNVARFVALCDLDSVRMADAKTWIEGDYARKFGSGKYANLKTYADYREMIEDKSIDAVAISTPDHWHAQPAIEAALAGKDIYLQKPASLTIKEGRQMADAVKRSGRIFQQGSQQRSGAQFRLACELVRNGRIGKVREVYIGLPTDPAGGNSKEMPVPSTLNYDMWLGSTPLVYYTEDRVHPQSAELRGRYGRPGWLRCEQFGAGMITGWGAHHVDTAHWGMGAELTGPVEIEAMALFPKQGLWDVHGPYHIRARYASGAVMYISDKYPNGIKFLGDDGWIWVTRGRFSAVDMQALGASGGGRQGGAWRQAIDASDRRWIKDGIKDSEIHLHESPKNDHHLDWLTSIQTRKDPVAPAEVGHRANTVCLLAQIAMHIDRVLYWDPEKETFTHNDDEANRKLSRPQRAPYGTNSALEKAGPKI